MPLVGPRLPPSWAWETLGTSAFQGQREEGATRDWKEVRKMEDRLETRMALEEEGQEKLQQKEAVAVACWIRHPRTEDSAGGSSLRAFPPTKK